MRMNSLTQIASIRMMKRRQAIAIPAIAPGDNLKWFLSTRDGAMVFRTEIVEGLVGMVRTSLKPSFQLIWKLVRQGNGRGEEAYEVYSA